VITSQLVETDLRRVALRVEGTDAIAFAEDLLARCSLVPITTALLRSAGSLLPAGLRSLDAIHLATALSVQDVAGEFACYDSRLSEAARDAGFDVISPA